MKTRGDFHFKKFSISHDRSTHKIGTDGVLLGAWVGIQDAKNILDIGTGSGIIAIMLAQRSGTETQIDAVELLESDFVQAEENIARSPWPGKIKAYHTSIQHYTTVTQYDLIVSNPPFFINSWLPPDDKRSQARHTNSLTFADLLKAVKKLLKGTGRFAVVLPSTEGIHFTNIARDAGLNVSRRLSFRARKEKPVERLLIEFSFDETEVKEEELVLYIENEEWSEGYRSLTKDFYLKA